MSQPYQAPPPYSGNEKAPYPAADGGMNPSAGGYPAVAYAPPQQQVPPYVAQGQTTTIITTQPLIQPVVVRFGENPMSVTCPQCRAQVVTGIRYEVGTGVWLVAGVMCLVGLWLGCCLIPFCINGLKDVHHTCPNCNRMIGIYRRM